MGAITRLADKGGIPLTPTEADNNLGELDARTAIAWQNLPGAVSKDGIANAPPMRSYRGIYVMAFSATVEQEISVFFHIPKNYIAGSDIYPHIHLFTPTASSGNVKFSFSYSWAREYDAHDRSLGPPGADQIFGDPVTAYMNLLIEPGYHDTHMVLESDIPVSLPTLEGDSIILMRIACKCLDQDYTYPDEIYVSYADLYYQAQGFGAVHR